MTKFYCQVFLFSGFLGVSTCLLPSDFGSLVCKGVFEGNKRKLVVKFFKVELSLKIISEVRNSTIYIDYLQRRKLEKKLCFMRKKIKEFPNMRKENWRQRD